MKTQCALAGGEAEWFPSTGEKLTAFVLLFVCWINLNKTHVYHLFKEHLQLGERKQRCFNNYSFSCETNLSKSGTLAHSWGEGSHWKQSKHFLPNVSLKQIVPLLFIHYVWGERGNLHLETLLLCWATGQKPTTRREALEIYQTSFSHDGSQWDMEGKQPQCWIWFPRAAFLCASLSLKCTQES